MSKKSKETWFERLKKEREKQDFTQKELAEAVGSDQRTYNKWEQGQQETSFKNLVALCDVLGITTDYLLRGESKILYKPTAKEKLLENGISEIINQLDKLISKSK